MTRAALLVAGAALLVACSGGDDTTDAPTATADEPAAASTTDPAAPAATAPDATTETASDTTTDTTTAPESTPPTAPPTTQPAAEPEPLLAGFDELIELTVASGEVPDRPVLSWTAVDGADHYGVYVYAPNGEIYWAWQGRETSVTLGGAIGDAPGPAVADGMTWAVIAYDAALLPIGVSVVAPLAG